MDDAQVHAALGAVVDFATACNTYIEMTAPWKLAKDPERAETLDHVLYALAESLRIIAILVAPVLPKASQRNPQAIELGRRCRVSPGRPGARCPTAHALGKPSPVFPRIEADAA